MVTFSDAGKAVIISLVALSRRPGSVDSRYNICPAPLISTSAQYGAMICSVESAFSGSEKGE